MTLLQDYVRNTVDTIISAKLATRKYPPCVTLAEVMDEVAQDVRSCLNVLARSDDYDVRLTLNKAPCLFRKTSGSQPRSQEPA